MVQKGDLGMLQLKKSGKGPHEILKHAGMLRRVWESHDPTSYWEQWAILLGVLGSFFLDAMVMLQGGEAVEQIL